MMGAPPGPVWASWPAAAAVAAFWPEAPCRFGARCHRPGCRFEHPVGGDRLAVLQVLAEHWGWEKLAMERQPFCGLSVARVDESGLPPGMNGLCSEAVVAR